MGEQSERRGNLKEEWHHRVVGQREWSEKVLLATPPSPVVTLGTCLSSTGVRNEWSSCRLRAPAPFYGKIATTIHPPCTKKFSWKESIFCGPPPRPAHPNPPPITCFRIIPVVLLCLHFPDWGGLDVLLLEGVRGCRGTHIKRDDNIVFMDQGSCISFSKGTFFSIPFLY